MAQHPLDCDQQDKPGRATVYCGFLCQLTILNYSSFATDPERIPMAGNNEKYSNILQLCERILLELISQSENIFIIQQPFCQSSSNNTVYKVKSTKAPPIVLDQTEMFGHNGHINSVAD